jgi:hypothetical protein
MSIYRIFPIGGGSGFKVHVTDDAASLRVVGVFLSEAGAGGRIIAHGSLNAALEKDSLRLSSGLSG